MTYIKTIRMKIDLLLNCVCVHTCLAVPARCHVIQLLQNYNTEVQIQFKWLKKTDYLWLFYSCIISPSLTKIYGRRPCVHMCKVRQHVSLHI